jgi:hypothetical protein
MVSSFRYHHFRVRPPVGAVLNLEREPVNWYDPNATIAVTRQGQVVGRLPREVAAVVGPAMQTGFVFKAITIISGDMTHSGPGRGGGPKLNVYVILHVESEDALNFFNLVEMLLTRGGISEKDIFSSGVHVNDVPL